MTAHELQEKLNKIKVLIPFTVGVTPTPSQVEAGKDIEMIVDELSDIVWLISKKED